MITPALRTFVRADIYRSQINVANLRVNGNNDTSSVPDNTTTIKGIAGIAWDRRVGADGLPNPLMPVKGWLLQGSVGLRAADLSSSHVPRLPGAGAGHRAVQDPRRRRLRSSATCATTTASPSATPALPLVERFYAGGDTHQRGYDTDSLKSEIVRTDVSPLPGDSGFRVVPEGGNIRLVNTVEFQFPIAKSFLGLPLAVGGRAVLGHGRGHRRARI